MSNNNVIKKVIKFDGNEGFYEMKTVRSYFTEYMEENESEAMNELASLINKNGVINGIKVG